MTANLSEGYQEGIYNALKTGFQIPFAYFWDWIFYKFPMSQT